MQERPLVRPGLRDGGMLSIADELVRERNPDAELVLFGREMNPESWAVCRAEMLLKGQDPSRIASGSTLSADGHTERRFDYQLCIHQFAHALEGWQGEHGAFEGETLELARSAKTQLHR